MSDLAHRISNNLVEFPNETHLIGDIVYMIQTTWYIEHTFTYLKGRFRRLKLLETRVDWIWFANWISACILHNFCMINNDEVEDIMEVPNEIEEKLVQENIVNPRQEINRREGVLKRNLIMNNLGMWCIKVVYSMYYVCTILNFNFIFENNYLFIKTLLFTMRYSKALNTLEK